MGLYTEAGTRRTLSGVQKHSDPDPLVIIDEDLYEQVPLMHERGPDYGANASTEGSQRKLKWKAGKVLRTSELNAAFPSATATSFTPSTALATAGGTVITVKGTNLDGVTAVTVGGTAATGLVIVSPSELRFTTPAKSAGSYNVVFTDDSGTLTKTNALTFA